MTGNVRGLLRNVARQISPPIFLEGMKYVSRRFLEKRSHEKHAAAAPDQQDLDLYWDPKMAEVLESWGENSVWKEIQYLMVNCHGKVLDIACGTGKTMEIISKFPLDIHGCDISDLLIGKAIERGIMQDHLTVCDATKMPYEDDSFNYAYSIGSLEHFTEDGIVKLLKEAHRVVGNTAFHMVPVSRSGKDEGWLKTYQSFHNNSVDWWLGKCHSVYEKVYVIDSTWEDDISVGKWFVCVKE